MLSYSSLSAQSALAEPTPVVYVVDDDISVRESLETLIRCAGWRAETYETATAFLARAETSSPTCLILDVKLPDLNGLDLQRLIGREHEDIPIIFITGHGDIPMSVQAIKAGAVEFLTKPLRRDALLGAVRNALSISQAAMAGESERRRLRQDYASLTPREREVMAMAASGLMNKQIGWRLGISVITVKAHRAQAMRKMRAKSLAELISAATRLGLSCGAA